MSLNTSPNLSSKDELTEFDEAIQHVLGYPQRHLPLDIEHYENILKLEDLSSKLIEIKENMKQIENRNEEISNLKLNLSEFDKQMKETIASSETNYNKILNLKRTSQQFAKSNAIDTNEEHYKSYLSEIEARKEEFQKNLEFQNEFLVKKHLDLMMNQWK